MQQRSKRLVWREKGPNSSGSSAGCRGTRRKYEERLREALASLNIYKYQYIEGPVIIRQHIDLFKDAIIKGDTSLEVTLDLGLSKSQVVLGGDEINIGGYKASLPVLDREVEEGFVYKIIGQDLRRLDMFRDGNYYKLKPTSIGTAPTIEINGIQMHRTIGIDPWRDAYIKVKSLGRIKRLKILDIGSGLGYTASNLLRLRASEVVSIEKDQNVLSLAQMNPWSRMLGHEKIKIVIGDATKVIEKLCDQCFHKVLHDPPRINIAEELYSLEFYKELFRVLRSLGALFHYTGKPGSHTNVKYLKGIKERLMLAGFHSIVWDSDAQGYVAYKY